MNVEKDNSYPPSASLLKMVEHQEVRREKKRWIEEGIGQGIKKGMRYNVPYNVDIYKEGNPI